MEIQTILWLVIFVLMVLIELCTMGLTTIWFAGGALVAFLVALFGIPVEGQIVAFLVASFLMLFITRPIAMKHLNLKRVKTNVDDLAGKHAVVKEEIDNLKGTGQIILNGMEWTARSKDGQTIPVNTEVEVVEIQGVKAFVRPKSE